MHFCHCWKLLSGDNILGHWYYFQLMSTEEQILTITTCTRYSETGEGRKERLSNMRSLFSGL